MQWPNPGGTGKYAKSAGKKPEARDPPSELQKNDRKSIDKIAKPMEKVENGMGRPAATPTKGAGAFGARPLRDPIFYLFHRFRYFSDSFSAALTVDLPPSILVPHLFAYFSSTAWDGQGVGPMP